MTVSARQAYRSYPGIIRLLPKQELMHILSDIHGSNHGRLAFLPKARRYTLERMGRYLAMQSLALSAGALSLNSLAKFAVSVTFVASAF